MLVRSMNPDEITLEILRDFDKLRATTAERLGDEYDRERRKLKIDACKTYPKVYPIKTAAKNTWLLFLGKMPKHPKYKGRDSININFVVYYYGDKGLRVFNRTTGYAIDVYNNHFFKRYNQRMNLKLDDPIDIVKNYFMYGGFSAYSVIKKNDKEYTIGVSSEGILLGELRHNRTWLINKTFISRDLARPDQDEIENKLIANLQKEIDKALSSTQFNEDDLTINKNVVSALTCMHKDQDIIPAPRLFR